ncbi:hypothetical protein J8273_3210 [Carpediemonas membranifera]|uniref:Uncharacterized protein n=1 Tax=Carpediemonas membranifera TaxID=201153 RepID=A0A8J6BX44_9EUKA|nr:hypothetical protein J8273_3210 [Carpediemonas membranifera]|eukprot:KAG9393081.1 hypothetical protein J8273_3210 [Carpediemonas membranifera]
MAKTQQMEASRSAASTPGNAKQPSSQKTTATGSKGRQTFMGTFRRVANDTVKSLDPQTRRELQMATSEAIFLGLEDADGQADRVGHVFHAVTKSLTPKARMKVLQTGARCAVPHLVDQLTDSDSPLRRTGTTSGRVLSAQISDPDSIMWTQLCRKNSVFRTATRVLATSSVAAVEAAVKEAPEQVANPNSLSWKTFDMATREVTSQITAPDSALWSAVSGAGRVGSGVLETRATKLGDSLGAQLASLLGTKTEAKPTEPSVD